MRVGPAAFRPSHPLREAGFVLLAAAAYVALAFLTEPSFFRATDFVKGRASSTVPETVPTCCASTAAGGAGWARAIGTGPTIAMANETRAHTVRRSGACRSRPIIRCSLLSGPAARGAITIAQVCYMRLRYVGVFDTRRLFAAAVTIRCECGKCRAGSAARRRRQTASTVRPWPRPRGGRSASVRESAASGEA